MVYKRYKDACNLGMLRCIDACPDLFACKAVERTETRLIYDSDLIVCLTLSFMSAE